MAAVVYIVMTLLSALISDGNVSDTTLIINAILAAGIGISLTIRTKD